MAYIIPKLDALLDGIQRLRDEYLKDNTTPNPARLALLDVLDATAALINSQKLKFNRISQEELNEICLGAYLYCVEAISQEYRLLYPEGYVLNTGSKLYKLLIEQLGITVDNKPDNKDNLIYINKFFNHAFKSHKASMKQHLEKHQVDPELAKQSVKQVMSSIFYYLSGEAVKVAHSIPTEEALDSKMTVMLKKYSEKNIENNNNLERKRLAKIIVAFKNITNLNFDYDDSVGFISGSQRIKMGLLLTIMQSIWDTYWVRNPTGNSDLYDLCLDALNIKSVEDLDPALRAECLAAFRAYVTDFSHLAKLESTVNAIPDVIKVVNQDDTLIPYDVVLDIPDEQNVMTNEKNEKYVYTIMDDLRTVAGKMMETLKKQASSTYILTEVAKVCAIGGAVVLAPVGLGGGEALGFLVTQSNPAAVAKIAVDEVVSPAMTLVFAKNGKALGYFATSLVMDGTIKAALQLISASAAMLFGAAAGGGAGVVTVVITQATYQTFKNLCHYCLDLQTKHGSNLAKDVDPKFIDCLLTLPSDIYAKDEKLIIETVTKGVSQGGMFGHTVHVKLDKQKINANLSYDYDSEDEANLLRSSLGSSY